MWWFCLCCVFEELGCGGWYSFLFVGCFFFDICMEFGFFVVVGVVVVFVFVFVVGGGVVSRWLFVVWLWWDGFCLLLVFCFDWVWVFVVFDFVKFILLFMFFVFFVICLFLEFFGFYDLCDFLFFVLDFVVFVLWFDFLFFEDNCLFFVFDIDIMCGYFVVFLLLGMLFWEFCFCVFCVCCCLVGIVFWF